MEDMLGWRYILNVRRKNSYFFYWYIKVIFQCTFIVIIIQVYDKIVTLEKKNIEIDRLGSSKVYSLCSVFLYVMLSYVYLKYFQEIFPQNGIMRSLIVRCGIMIPSFIFIILNNEKMSSFGIMKRNILPSIIIGVVCSAVYIVTYIPINNINYSLLITKIDLKIFISFLYLFIYCIVIAFSEEFLFRGYLQTRLTACYGKKLGLLYATIIFALMHIPQLMVSSNYGIVYALVQSITYLPLGFVLGYLYMKTENLTSCVILHTFANWLVFAISQIVI